MYTMEEMHAGLKELEPLAATEDEQKLLDEDAEICEALRGSNQVTWSEWFRSFFD